MDRRRFLGLTAGVMTAPWWLPGCAPSTDAPHDGDDLPTGPPSVDVDADGGRVVDFDVDAIALDEAVFFVGAQAGAMTANSFRAWTRVSSASSKRLRLRVWRDVDDAAATDAGAGAQIVLVRDVTFDAAEDGTAKVELTSLAPSTWYRYAFFVDDDRARSVVGRVRTAWAADWQWPVTIASTTCTKHDHAPFQALQRLAEQDADLFIHTGDMVYADGSRTPADYRAFWERALNDPGYRALLVKQGGYFAWDDHEFDNNFNPESTSAAQLAAAASEFFASTPMTPNASGGLWQGFLWGKTVDVIVLDCRTERRPSTRTSDHPIYVGTAQMAWLKDRLKNSPARFKVVVNSVPMTAMPELWPKPDRWSGYEAQRNELLQFIDDEGIEDVWFVSGDFHVGFVGRVEPAGRHRRTWEVAVGPGGNLGNPLGYLATQDAYREQVFPADQFLYGKGELAATTLTFDPLRGRVRIRFVDVDGGVLFDQTIDRDT